MGEVDAVGTAAVLVEPLGDGLRDPGTDSREVEREQLGVDVLAHDLGAEAGEVLNLQAAFFPLIGFLHAPAQVVEALEPGARPGNFVMEGGRQHLGLAVVEGHAYQAHGDGVAGKIKGLALFAGLWTGREGDQGAARPGGEEGRHLVGEGRRHPGAELAVLHQMQHEQPERRVTAVIEDQVHRTRGSQMLPGQNPFADVVGEHIGIHDHVVEDIV